MNDFPVLVIGASAGGLAPMRTITESLPPGCTAALAVVMHIGANPNYLADILNWHSALPFDFVQDGEGLLPGRIYVAPSDRHVVLMPPGCFQLEMGTKVHNTGPVIDPLFISAAAL